MSTWAEHGGDVTTLAALAGLPASDIVDFSANINPLGPPAWLEKVVAEHLSEVAHYPDPLCREFVRAVCERHSVLPEEVLAGNGSTELLHLLPRALPVRRALIPVPSFTEYERAAQLARLPVERILLREDQGFAADFDLLDRQLQPGDLLVVGQPNNPTGRAYDAVALRWLARRHADAWVVVDEAFVDFLSDDCQPGEYSVDGEALAQPMAADYGHVPDYSLIPDRLPNVVVVRSLTKSYAIPGLRLGYLVADAAVVKTLRDFVLPWSVNCLSQAVGVAALRDEEYLREARLVVQRERRRLTAALSGMEGLKVYAGQANFLLVRLQSGDAAQLARSLLEQGLAIRVCGDFAGLDARYFRFAVRTEPENTRLITALCQNLGGGLGCVADCPATGHPAAGRAADRRAWPSAT